MRRASAALNIFYTAALVACCSVQKAGAAPSPTPMPEVARNELGVTLFGQPCTLTGSIDKESLRAIHTISPEQTFVDSTRLSPEPIQKTLDKVKTAKPVPAWLEAYRERLIKRLEAQLAFTRGLADAKKEKSSGPLLTAVKGRIAESRSKEFKQLAAELSGKKQSPSLDLRLFDLYNELIEPDPEEEFHRSIRRMDVRYACEFSDEDAHEESE